jgi:phage-related protein
MDIIPQAKPLVWAGRSKSDLLRLPDAVIDMFGYALYLAQIGRRHPSAKPMSGWGDARVMEVVETHDRCAYRAVYTTRFEKVVVVLHVFQKKSKRAISTPRTNIALIRRRMQMAERMFRSDAG